MRTLRSKLLLGKKQKGFDDSCFVFLWTLWEFREIVCGILVFCLYLFCVWFNRSFKRLWRQLATRPVVRACGDTWAETCDRLVLKRVVGFDPMWHFWWGLVFLLWNILLMIFNVLGWAATPSSAWGELLIPSTTWWAVAPIYELGLAAAPTWDLGWTAAPTCDFATSCDETCDEWLWWALCCDL